MGIELKNTVYREGEGIPVVLVHGFPVDHRMWDQCAAALARICDEHGMTRFPIWAPDMPGAGEARFRVTKPAEARTRTARSRMPLIAWRTHTWT